MAELNPNIILAGDNSQIFNPVKAQAAQNDLAQQRFNLSMNPLKAQEAQQKVDSGDIELQNAKIDHFLQTADMLQQNPAAWTQVKQKLEGQGLLPQGTMPDQPDSAWLAKARMSLVDAKTKLAAQMQANLLGARLKIAGIDNPTATTNPAPDGTQQPTPYIADRADANGKTTSSYVSDVSNKVKNGADIYSAILNQESGGDPNSATSANGAVGQYQILPATFAKYAKPGEDIRNPTDNMAVGRRIIDDLSTKFGNDPQKIATAYFSGEGNVNKGTVPEDNSKPPTKRPDETTKAYSARVTAWKADPANIANAADARASSTESIKSSDNLAKEAIASHQVMTTLDTLEAATKSFESGATADAKTQVARLAKAMGYPLSPEDEASLDSKQVFFKVSNELIGQAAKAEGGASRLQAAFNAIKSSNPNATMEPGALKVIIDYMREKANVPIQMQQEWQKAKMANPRARFNDFQTNYVSDLNSKPAAVPSVASAASASNHPLDKFLIQ